MSSAISRRSALTLAAVTVVTGVVAYAVYFDYRRRNDASFRRKLRKEKKRVERAATSTSTPPTSSRSLQEIQEALQLIRNEQLPATPDEKEKYFMENLGMGEQLSAQGPMFEVAAALHFYRALRVYPSPVDLIVVFQKTIPESIFKIVMEMTSIDVSETPEAEGQPAVTPASPAHATQGLGSGSGDEHSSPGPPSESSSLEWDRLTDSGVAVEPPSMDASEFPPL